MSENKMHYHATTVHVSTGQNNPPPYTPNAYPPPPSGPYPAQYPPQPQYAGPTVVQATVVPGVVPVMIAQNMGPNPARATCKSCNYEIVTRVVTKPSLRTHLFAGLLCLIGLWPCVCIPYCMDSCMNTDHYCPRCNSYVGSYYT